mgnify:FL=1
MTIFDHPLWPSLLPFSRLSEGRDNLDLLQLPDDLRTEAVKIVLPCVACAAPIRVFRARVKSNRSRIANQVEERRMFYAATCPASVNPGCARSKAAKDHKRFVRERLSGQREAAPAISVQVLDASGAVLYAMRSEVKEPFQVDLPKGAATIAFVPA